jgi:hypothetical protein
MNRSTKTIRADEARRVFDVAGEGIVWAVRETVVHRITLTSRNTLTWNFPHRCLKPISGERLTRDLAGQPNLAKTLNQEEALVDMFGLWTHSAGIIAGESTNEDQPCIGIAAQVQNPKREGVFKHLRDLRNERSCNVRLG